MTRPDFSRLSVLIADPSPHLVTVLASMLRSFGIIDIRDASAPGPLAALLNLRRFDLLIVDDSTSELDGAAITARLRTNANAPNRHIDVIMIASQPSAARLARARDAGITEFLRKPFAARDLQTRLTAILANPRPFIAASGFAGPDRRRRLADFEGADRRGNKG